MTWCKMTEAGRKWMVEKTGEASSFDEAEAGFWLRAFCEEVEKRATHPLDRNGVLARGTLNAYNELKRELLGE